MNTKAVSLKEISVKVAKDLIHSGSYGILMAGVLGAAAMGVMNGLHAKSTYEKIVQPTISEACMQPGSAQSGYRLSNTSSELTAAMLFKHPKDVQQICAAMNASVAKGNMFIRYDTPVIALSNAMGMDTKSAHTIIETAAFKKDVESRKSEIKKTYVHPDWASRPGL